MTTAKFQHALFISLAICTASIQSNAELPATFTGLASGITVVLPLEVKLSAATSNNSSAITWEAVKAIAVRRYELEKSTDGENFNYLTAMPGKASTYSYEDGASAEAISYYRLKIVTASGNYRYSKVISINKKETAAAIRVLPGQLDGKLFILVPTNTTVSNAVITDAAGRIVATPFVTNMTNLANMAIADLKAGLYSMRVTTNTGEVLHLKFAKAK